MATVKDIAERTGYSRSTISRVLNKDSTFVVSEETRQKIFDCAEELNYDYQTKSKKNVVNQYKDYKVAVVPIGLDLSGQGELQDPYYLYIRNGVESRLEEMGFRSVRNIPLHQYSDYKNLEGMDGMIVIGKKKFDEQNIYMSCLKDIVFIDHDYDPQRYDCVLSDFPNAMKLALDYLREGGYKSIGYIGSWDYINDFGSNTMIRRIDSRQTAYENYMISLSEDYQKHMYIGEKFTAAVGYDLTKQAILSGQLPEAFIIGSDPMSIGVYRAFDEYGIKIGTDIGIVSIDGNEDTKYMTPSLTTVEVHAFQMGRCAVDCLMQQIDGRKIPIKVVLPVELIAKESS